MMTTRERYRNEAVFRNLVDVLENAIENLQLTPSEIREAAMLAAIHYEERHIRPMYIKMEPKDG